MEVIKNPSCAMCGAIFTEEDYPKTITKMWTGRCLKCEQHFFHMRCMMGISWVTHVHDDAHGFVIRELCPVCCLEASSFSLMFKNKHKLLFQAEK